MYRKGVKMTYEELKEKLDEYFSDTSRSPEETKEGLLTISEDAQIMAETIIVDGGE